MINYTRYDRGKKLQLEKLRSATFNKTKNWIKLPYNPYLKGRNLITNKKGEI